MQYFEATADHALHHIFDERDLDCFSLVTYLELDYAGDVFDTRSTSGAAQFETSEVIVVSSNGLEIKD